MGLSRVDRSPYEMMSSGLSAAEGMHFRRAIMGVRWYAETLDDPFVPPACLIMLFPARRVYLLRRMCVVQTGRHALSRTQHTSNRFVSQKNDNCRRPLTRFSTDITIPHSWARR